jgi:hypothetical protein
VQATNPEVVFVASYLPDSVGIVRGSHPAEYRTGEVIEPYFKFK